MSDTRNLLSTGGKNASFTGVNNTLCLILIVFSLCFELLQSFVLKREIFYSWETKLRKDSFSGNMTRY